MCGCGYVCVGGGEEWRGGGVEWRGRGSMCVGRERGEVCVCVGGESGLGIEGGRQCDGKHISACGHIWSLSAIPMNRMQQQTQLTVMS